MSDKNSAPEFAQNDLTPYLRHKILTEGDAPGTITPSSIQPGADGEVLTTVSGVAAWANAGGSASITASAGQMVMGDGAGNGVGSQVTQDGSNVTITDRALVIEDLSGGNDKILAASSTGEVVTSQITDDGDAVIVTNRDFQVTTLDGDAPRVIGVNNNGVLIDGMTTDYLPEGGSNLYFTNQRAIDAVDGFGTVPPIVQNITDSDIFLTVNNDTDMLMHTSASGFSHYVTIPYTFTKRTLDLVDVRGDLSLPGYPLSQIGINPPQGWTINGIPAYRIPNDASEETAIQMTVPYTGMRFVFSDDMDQVITLNVNGVTDTNTDNGVLYLKVLYQSDIYYIQLFREPSVSSSNDIMLYTDSTLIPGGAKAGQVINLIPLNNSNLSGTITLNGFTDNSITNFVFNAVGTQTLGGDGASLYSSPRLTGLSGGQTVYVNSIPAGDVTLYIYDSEINASNNDGVTGVLTSSNSLAAPNLYTFSGPTIGGTIQLDDEEGIFVSIYQDAASSQDADINYNQLVKKIVITSAPQGNGTDGYHQKWVNNTESTDASIRELKRYYDYDISPTSEIDTIFLEGITNYNSAYTGGTATFRYYADDGQYKFDVKIYDGFTDVTVAQGSFDDSYDFALYGHQHLELSQTNLPNGQYSGIQGWVNLTLAPSGGDQNGDINPSNYSDRVITLDGTEILGLTETYLPLVNDQGILYDSGLQQITRYTTAVVSYDDDGIIDSVVSAYGLDDTNTNQGSVRWAWIDNGEGSFIFNLYDQYGSVLAEGSCPSSGEGTVPTNITAYETSDSGVQLVLDIQNAPNPYGSGGYITGYNSETRIRTNFPLELGMGPHNNQYANGYLGGQLVTEGNMDLIASGGQIKLTSSGTSGFSSDQIALDATYIKLSQQGGDGSVLAQLDSNGILTRSGTDSSTLNGKLATIPLTDIGNPMIGNNAQTLTTLYTDDFITAGDQQVDLKFFFNATTTAATTFTIALKSGSDVLFTNGSLALTTGTYYVAITLLAISTSKMLVMETSGSTLFTLTPAQNVTVSDITSALTLTVQTTGVSSANNIFVLDSYSRILTQGT